MASTVYGLSGEPITPPSSGTPSDSSDPMGSRETIYLECLSTTLGLDKGRIDLQRSFIANGGNSILAIRFRSMLSANKIQLPLKTILGHLCLDTLLFEAQDPALDEHSLSISELSRRLSPVARGSIPSGSHTAPSTPAPSKAVQPTEMQAALLAGSQYIPGMNLITLVDHCHTDMIPMMKSAWQRVLTAEPIFNVEFRSDENGFSMYPQDKQRFAWEEVTVFDELAFRTEFARQSKMTGARWWFKVVSLMKPYSQARGESIICWNVHHAFVDGYAANLLYEKVLSTVNGYHQTPGRSFLEVARDLKSMQHDSRQEAQKFWLETDIEFSDARGTLSLNQSLAEGCECNASNDAAVLDFESFGIMTDLPAFSRRTSFSTSAIIHAAWALVLSTWLDCDKVVFGAVFAGRNLPLSGAMETIGPLINTLPLHVAVNRNDTVTQYLQQVSERIMKLDQYQYSAPQDGYDRSVFNSAMAAEFEMPASPFSNGSKPSFTMLTDIPLSILFKDNSIRLCYSKKNFSKTVIMQMADCLQNAITSLSSAHSNLTVFNSLDAIISRKSKMILMSMGNCLGGDTSLDTVKDDLVTLFEKAADIYSEQIALEQGSNSVSYRELDRMASVVAAHVSPLILEGEVVCVAAESSINWIVSIYGVLKAGGVYCPLNRSSPPSVLSQNFAATKARLLLLPTSNDSPIELEGCQTRLFVDQILALDSSLAPSRRPHPRPSTEAYVCFTSGTSGKPKGVVCTHAGLVAFQKNPDVRLRAAPGIRVSQVMSPVFDGSIHEIFSTLSYGSTLVLGDELNPLAHLHNVDSVLLTPSIAAAINPTDFTNLKNVYMVGEAVPQDVADTWSSHVEVFNMYGPTEGTCGATIKRLEPGRLVTLGRPNPSTRVYILNRQQMLVPPGVPGEIYLGGVQVSCGYIQRPEETAARFLIDTICPDPGSMMYRTGDIGYWNSYGEIRLIGRNDRQVKLRGFRIDLDDVEVRLRKNMPSGTGVAVARRHNSLVAMVGSDSLTVEEVMAVASSCLPPHSIPAMIDVREKLPLTPIGKVDYKALLGAFEAGL